MLSDSKSDEEAAKRDDGLHGQNAPHIELDAGGDEGAIKLRTHWYQLWLPKNPPPPAPDSFDDAKTIPLAKASIISELTYSWITDIMVLGYKRSLQATDLWKMDKSREVETVSAKLEAAWEARVRKADEWNRALASGEARPGLFLQLRWHVSALKRLGHYREVLCNSEENWRMVGGRKQASLIWALNEVFGFNFWLGGISKVLSDTMQLMIPLVIRAIINFAQQREASDPRNIGVGVAMAIGVFLLTAFTSVFQHQFFWRSMSTGVIVRGALTSMVYKRGVMLTPSARNTMPNSRLVNFVSSDISRIDACAQWFHPAWTAPIQATVCLIILLTELGAPALAGFGLFIMMAPVQRLIMGWQFKIRKKSVSWTDRRAKLLMEILGAMRIVKYFTYEKPFLERIFGIRRHELTGVVRIQFAQSANYAVAFSLPVLSACLSFVTYTSTTNSFDPAVIFPSFSLFNLLRQPLLFLPRALSSVADAQNALVRLSELFLLPTLSERPIDIDPKQELALHVKDATFVWTQVQENPAEKKRRSPEKDKSAATPKRTSAHAPRPFRIENISLEIPRGQLVGIVGSLLQGLLGEMPKVSGQVAFGGTVGYCPQIAWVQNATLRDNILFGQPWDEEKYWKVIENASLLADLDALPGGDQTEIGEKGINLSGGQKQRVNIARALYYDADVIIMDDPLSAVDAHVGRALFQSAIHDYLRGRGKTVILVTHALHFLPECDYVYTVHSGKIDEHGTYRELIDRGGTFSRWAREFGGYSDEKEDDDDEAEAEAKAPVKIVDVGDMMAKAEKHKPSAGGRLEGRLVVPETRNTGRVSWIVWKEYLKAGNGLAMAPLVLIFALLMQVASGLNGYTLVWWESNQFNKPFSFYQALYAGLGVAQAFFTLLMGLSSDVLGVFVSQNLHHRALRNVFGGRMSFFDTTPLGRIIGIFGKDIDGADDQAMYITVALPHYHLSLRVAAGLLTMSMLPSSIVIITIVEHYFIIPAVIILCIYAVLANFYGASARELKRLDSMLRSYLYAHFTESLSGLPTIRSYGEIPRFIHEENYYIDLENRALFLVVTNQRQVLWLAIRLDALGAVLTFIVAIIAVVGTSGISAAQIGLALTYVATVTQTASAVTRQQAELENYMNSVERVIYYSRGDAVVAEAPHELLDSMVPREWPSQGAIEFKDVRLAYRPGLPDVLKGITLDIRGSERIGIVGRTGAGKSSLITALFRLVELNAGSITIDGIDISTLGLTDLRSRIAIIPQEPLLFSGTVRSNLDPFSLHDDARLWDALRRSYLASKDGATGVPSSGRITLDAAVEPDGANLSVGQRSLLSLARALVKDSKIVVLDEATASVDLETDSKIQDTIQTEFGDRTLLCIAHRLRTILSYDRILVLENGNVAEFDTPLNLFEKVEGIFHSMCVGSGITVEEIKASQRP
ncbi:ABC protein [Vararia minispora EC-137]|uniref:ABC protein n=1 Tax=Vararia minispora EC-137 TaxID=1314806 RepID=A0ACB8QUJ7_9AGAM|nr:ABC protein [Vararia minispora EC-137]